MARALPLLTATEATATLTTATPTTATTATGRCTEGGHFDQVVELRSECQSDKSSIGRNNSGHRQCNPVRDETDLWREPDGESTDCWLQSQHKWSLRPIEDRCRIAIEQCDLGSKQEVGPFI